jgi:hypothetical protein
MKPSIGGRTNEMHVVLTFAESYHMWMLGSKGTSLRSIKTR